MQLIIGRRARLDESGRAFGLLGNRVLMMAQTLPRAAP